MASAALWPVYRAAKRLAAAGAAAVQLEDSADMEESTKILPRDKYMAKDSRSA